MSKTRKLVKAVFELMDTKPSKRTIVAVAVIAMVSFGMGMAYQQRNTSGQTPVDCNMENQGLETKYPVVEPYYNYSIGACMVPQIYLDNRTENPGGENTTVNQTQ